MTESDRTVFIIEDEQDVRKIIELHIASAGMTCRCYPSAEAFLKEVSHEGPACLVTDVVLPGMTGMKLLETLQQSNRDLPVVLLTGHADVDLAVRAFRSGAFDFLVKPVSGFELIEVARRAVDESAARIQARARQREVEERLRVLTNREFEIVPLLLTGATSKEMARVLSISHRTVEFYRHNVFRKLGVRSATELAALLQEHGRNLPPLASAKTR